MPLKSWLFNLGVLSAHKRDCAFRLLCLSKQQEKKEQRLRFQLYWEDLPYRMHCPWVHSYGDKALEGACGGRLGPGPCTPWQGLLSWNIHTKNLGDLYQCRFWFPKSGVGHGILNFWQADEFCSMNILGNKFLENSLKYVEIHCPLGDQTHG